MKGLKDFLRGNFPNIYIANCQRMYDYIFADTMQSARFSVSIKDVIMKKQAPPLTMLSFKHRDDLGWCIAY